MIPKEKAKELIGKFLDIEMPKDCNYSNIGKDNAKQCALIVVDEIFKTGLLEGTLNWHDVNGNKKYWEEVKKEIELL